MAGITNWVAAAGVTLIALVVAVAERAARRLEGVTGADLVERQVAEGRHAAGDGHGGRPAQGRAARVVQDRDR